ncbi:MAG: hypothetical protein K2K37_00360, partial [Muribaculaceae bacterium]|nr:hypothetical protein [Muribaculaceae bacterium]
PMINYAEEIMNVRQAMSKKPAAEREPGSLSAANLSFLPDNSKFLFLGFAIARHSGFHRPALDGAYLRGEVHIDLRD